MATTTTITNVLSGLNSIPRLPDSRLLDDAAGATLEASFAAQRAKGKMAPLIDDMQSKGWVSDMLKVEWIKTQGEKQAKAYTAFRDSLVSRMVSTMSKEARALIDADDGVAKGWPDGSKEPGRDYFEVTKNNRKYWYQQKGALVSGICKGLDRRKEQGAKDKRAAELAGKPDAAELKAKDDLFEKINAIVAAAAQSVKALDKSAKASKEPTDSKSRVGKMLGKLRSVVNSGSEFGIEPEKKPAKKPAKKVGK
jgi:hypothetical protein